ncbi:MAG TPA: hypothetical protein VFL36_09915 [Myxococcales bacterium]|nr:hypothetical protein [Myxococcales bacterium]
MKKLVPPLAIALCALAARATPTTTVWAPSTTAIQPFLTPHLTYDTYFWRRGSAGSTSSAIYPVTTGLTMGVLPFDNLQLEVGFDLLLPADNPLLLNAKLGIPEDRLLKWMPSFAIGIMGVGTKGTTATQLGTDYDMLYAQAQHSLPFGGFVSVGGYYGLQPRLYLSSAGDEQRAGFIGGAGSPDIVVDLPWLQKVTLTADVQTGKNTFGAAAGALNLFFTDKISVLMGPVYFFDRSLQPGSSQVMWTMQLDIDMPLRPAAPASPAAPAAAAPAPAPANARAEAK